MNITARTRVTIGLTCLLVSLMVTLISVGIGPNEHKAKMQGRAKLTESMAIGCALHLNRNQLDEVRTLLRAYVSRNSEIESAALRRETGGISISAGPHPKIWEDGKKDASQLVIPLKTGSVAWGDLEIKFVDDSPKGIYQWAHQPWPRFVLLVSSLGFFVISFYLGMTLKQLDPSRVVPKSVRVALDTIAEGLILTDRKGRVAIANKSFADWAGKDPDKFIGVRADSMPWQSGSENGKNHDPFPWDEALEFKQPQVRSMKLLDANKKIRSLIAYSSPILGPDGTYRGVLTSFEDVSELEEHKRELSKAKIAADNANRAKSDFLARMSHEIRTPMNAILGYTEVLRDSNNHSLQDRVRYLTTIQNSGEHLLALINDILDLSKVEAGQMELDVRPTSTIGVLKHVISVLKIRAQSKGIELGLGFSGQIPEQIMTDELRLKQTIINLVGNAIKFTDKGGVAVVGRMDRVEGRDVFCIDIGDTGIGMTKEQCEKIFDPFAQADTSITREYGGTGLGLAICKQLAEKMGGQISVQSTPGQGSVFTVAIDPGDLSGVEFVDGNAIDIDEYSHNSDAESHSVRFDGKSILVVDDGESNRELLALLLGRKGAVLGFAKDGQEAVNKVMAGRFDIVLMDMQMPVMDGFTATQTLRAAGNKTPIVACTANAMRDDELECLEAGCDGFLPKPISKKRLYECLEEMIGSTGPDVVEQAAPPQRTEPQPNRVPDSVSSSSTEPLVSDLPLDDEEFRGIVVMFAERLRAKFAEMESAAAAQNFEELACLSHWLKGSGGTAGFHQFTEPAAELEQAAKASDANLVITRMTAVRELVNRVVIEPVALPH